MTSKELALLLRTAAAELERLGEIEDRWKQENKPVALVVAKQQSLVTSSRRFNDWWALWITRRGSNHRPQAGRAWVSVVTPDNEEALFECTRSYLDSLNGSAGYNPDNFIFEQHRDGFAARWPPCRSSASTRKMELMDEFQTRLLQDIKDRSNGLPEKG